MFYKSEDCRSLRNNQFFFKKRKAVIDIAVSTILQTLEDDKLVEKLNILELKQIAQDWVYADKAQQKSIFLALKRIEDSIIRTVNFEQFKINYHEMNSYLKTEFGIAGRISNCVLQEFDLFTEENEHIFSVLLTLQTILQTSQDQHALDWLNSYLETIDCPYALNFMDDKLFMSRKDESNSDILDEHISIDDLMEKNNVNADEQYNNSKTELLTLGYRNQTILNFNFKT
ncbi:MAG: hypothetical protein QG624_305 [Pseudomonadota bacterium]|nr:hypothetical protein [Pseudomonadota bacterium]